MTLDGDIEIDPDTGDFRVAEDDDYLTQNIVFRLKTYQGDWTLEPDCGASLEDMVGEENSERVGDEIKTRVVEALTHDGFIAISDLTVETAPLTANTIAVLVQVSRPGTGISSVMASLDLRKGLVFARALNRP